MGILVVYGISPGFEVLYFPLLLISIILFSVAIGLLFTPIGLIYTDINRFISTGVSFLMYITPVVYAIPEKGLFKKLFELNPLTFLFNDARNSLLGIKADNLIFSITIALISFIVLLIGLVIFRKSMPIIIEKIGA